MSPYTVAIAIVPLLSSSAPLAASVSFIFPNEFPTVSALSKSWGRNFFPVSKSFPTLSSAGTMQLFITFTGASDFKSSSVAAAAFSLKPFSIMVIRLSSRGFAPVFFSV